MTAPSKKALPVFLPETRLSLLQVIEQAAEPLKSAQLAKLTPSTPKLRGQEIAALLTEDLAAGRIFNWGTAATPTY